MMNTLRRSVPVVMTPQSIQSDAEPEISDLELENVVGGSTVSGEPITTYSQTLNQQSIKYSQMDIGYYKWQKKIFG